jgi:polo-like kinase 1
VPSTASTAFGSRIDFKDNCGAIVEERTGSGRVQNRWRCGRILGRGGFAKCFEFINVETRETVACKVIEKASLSKPKAWQKLQSEIAIHKKMKHSHIVNFLTTFQDSYYVYITLEICHDRTLMELIKTRGRFTQSETQYFMLQILSSVQYMHDNNVIHRDLKLGNVMLHEMVVKIGDFGLAAEVAYDGERKRTICGTPNYIAPEILEGSHSFEVDIWSIGVILYTMLVGSPPFETADVKTTYSRIKQCKYSFPSDVDVPESAKRLVHKILQATPTKRPTLAEIRGDVFFQIPIPPMITPASLLADSMVPRARGISADPNAGQEEYVRKTSTDRCGREPLRAFLPNTNVAGPMSARACRDHSPPAAIPMTVVTPLTTNAVSAPRSGSVPAAPRYSQSLSPPSAWAPLPTGTTAAAPTASQSPSPVPERFSVVPCVVQQQSAAPTGSQQPTRTVAAVEDEEDEHHLTRLHENLHRTLLQQDIPDEPRGSFPGGPTVWVTDYADFSHKYGLSYRLNTGNTGVHFNDNTKMVWDHPTNGVEYVARQKETVYGTVVAQDVRSAFNMDTPPSTLTKKVTLIKYFRTYLGRQTATKEGGVEVVSCTNSPAPLTSSTGDITTYVKRWMPTKDALIFRLSNRTIQVCFFDKTEIVLSSESKVVTYTDKYGTRKTYGLKEAGTKDDVAPRLAYTKDVLFRLLSK